MNLIQRLEQWGDNHHPKWLDFIRIALGLFLCYKSVTFLIDTSYLVSLMNKANMGVSSFMIVLFGQFIIIVTLLSGIFMIMGLHTRIICMIQIPILIAAILLLNLKGTGVRSAVEFSLTILTLAVLVGFLFIGDGPLSYDKLFHEEDKSYRAEHEQLFK